MSITTSSPHFIRVHRSGSAVVSAWSADGFEELSKSFTGHSRPVSCVAEGAFAVYSADAGGGLASFNAKTHALLWKRRIVSHQRSLATLGPKGVGVRLPRGRVRPASLHVVGVDLLLIRTVAAGTSGARAQQAAATSADGIDSSQRSRGSASVPGLAPSPSGSRRSGVALMLAASNEDNSGGGSGGTDGDTGIDGADDSGEEEEWTEGVGASAGTGYFEYLDDADSDDGTADAHAAFIDSGVPGMVRLFSGATGVEVASSFLRRVERLNTITQCVFVPYDQLSGAFRTSTGNSSPGVVVLGHVDGVVEVWDCTGAPTAWKLRWHGCVVSHPSSAASSQAQTPHTEGGHGLSVGDQASASTAAGGAAPITMLRVASDVLVAASSDAVCAWSLASIMAIAGNADAHSDLGGASDGAGAGVRPATLLAWLYPGCDLWHRRPLQSVAVFQDTLYVFCALVLGV